MKPETTTMKQAIDFLQPHFDGYSIKVIQNDLLLDGQPILMMSKNDYEEFKKNKNENESIREERAGE